MKKSNRVDKAIKKVKKEKEKAPASTQDHLSMEFLNSLDPRHSVFQMEIFKKGTQLMNDLLVEAEALDAFDVESKVKIMNTFIAYRKMLLSDYVLIIQELAAMPLDKVRILMGQMSAEKIISDFKQGSLSLEQIYGLKDSKKVEQKSTS